MTNERERERERILYEMDGEKHMIENILFLAKGQKSFLSLGFFFFFWPLVLKLSIEGNPLRYVNRNEDFIFYDSSFNGEFDSKNALCHCCRK